MRRWRAQPGPPRRPGAVTMVAVGLVAFASAFGVARAAGGDEPAASPALVKAQPLQLRTASALPALEGEPGPTDAELEARRGRARERARKLRLAKKHEERKAAEEAAQEAARQERLRLRAERRAQRAAEREAEAKRQLAAERRRRARERERRQQERARQQPVRTAPEPRPPTTTTPAPEQFDDSG
jgi:hypothetical protein